MSNARCAFRFSMLNLDYKNSKTHSNLNVKVVSEIILRNKIIVHQK